MATIIEVNEIQNKIDASQKTCPPIDKNIMEQIIRVIVQLLLQKHALTEFRIREKQE